MDYKLFLIGIKNIISDPSRAWQAVENENITAKEIRNSILLPLIILASIATFTGSMLFANSELLPAYSILTGIKSFIALFCTVYLTSYILGEVTYPMDLGKDFQISFRIITLSFVPFMICQVFSGIFESLMFVNVIGLYGLYIFWAGADKFFNPPQYKKLPLLIAATATAVIIYVATNVVLKMFLDRIYYAFFD
jgi:hypothetical protein